jgi:hypothetical protein
MSSSTSSSEPAGRERRWAGFIVTFLGTAAAALALLLAAVFLIDPYDTGRSPLALGEGVRDQGPRTAAASRGRDPAFRGAILGNSQIQLISPQELAARTGIPFVSLIAPATGPRETLVLLDWFLSHRRGEAEAIVIGIDDRWCTADPALPSDKPFPDWLFEPSLPRYLAGLLRFEAVEEVPRRIAYLVSGGKGRARPDGYWNYEADYLRQGYDSDPSIRARLNQPAETGGGNVDGPFPAAARLAEAMRAAPRTMLILVRPPVYATALPAPGSRSAAADAACRDAFASLAANRPLTRLVDGREDRPELHDPSLFFDHRHYRLPLARLMEARIAEAIRSLR